MTDAPTAGRLVRILLKVRRFFCGNPECRSKTFVEQVDGLTRRWSRMAEAGRTAAPEAVQVADRFHLWQNLATDVEKCVARHKSCLAEPIDTTLDEPDAAGSVDPTGVMAERPRAHHALVHELLAQGAGFRQISRHLGWSRRTVSKYAHAATWQELVVDRNHDRAWSRLERL